MKLGIADRVAMVTGAGSGIGEATAIALAKEGVRVVCADINASNAAATATTIRAMGVDSHSVTLDVSDHVALAHTMDSVQKAIGPVELAVNCAGIAAGTAAIDMTPGQWSEVLNIDLTGTFYCSQAQARHMIPRQYGRIVNIASISASIINRGIAQANYNAAKAAVVHLSRALAVEWAPYGIRVNSLSPGYTATAMNRRAEVADRVTEFIDATPARRMAEPSEIASAAVFLLSDAASFITGVDLLADGGATLW